MIQPDHLSEVVARGFEIGMLQVAEEAQMFANWLVQNPYSTFLEIGTAHGGLFHVLYQLRQGFPSGLAVSVDLARGIHGVNANFETRAKLFPESVNWIVGSSFLQETVDAVKNILEKAETSLDLLVIDGDHRFADVDFDLYSPFVRSGGHIVFHDIVDSPRHRAQGVTVVDFWKKLTGFRIELLAGQDWGGIGIWRKP